MVTTSANSSDMYSMMAEELESAARKHLYALHRLQTSNNNSNNNSITNMYIIT